MNLFFANIKNNAQRKRIPHLLLRFAVSLLGALATKQFPEKFDRNCQFLQFIVDETRQHFSSISASEEGMQPAFAQILLGA